MEEESTVSGAVVPAPPPACPAGGPVVRRQSVNVSLKSDQAARPHGTMGAPSAVSFSGAHLSAGGPGTPPICWSSRDRTYRLWFWWKRASS